ncbi:hypothetical protein JX266_010844 [Neoarthrinium moseri]|nr:hypothetical protein JX266_010844 [Neoarthrinium moseri]
MPSTNTLGFHESHQGAIAESSASSVTFVEHYPSILAVPMPTVTPSPERWELPSIGDDIPNGMGLLGWADQKIADRKVQYGHAWDAKMHGASKDRGVENPDAIVGKNGHRTSQQGLSFNPGSGYEYHHGHQLRHTMNDLSVWSEVYGSCSVYKTPQLEQDVGSSSRSSGDVGSIQASSLLTYTLHPLADRQHVLRSFIQGTLRDTWSNGATGVESSGFNQLVSKTNTAA